MLPEYRPRKPKIPDPITNATGPFLFIKLMSVCQGGQLKITFNAHFNVGAPPPLKKPILGPYDAQFKFPALKSSNQ